MPKYHIVTEKGEYDIETAGEGAPVQGAHPEARMSAAFPDSGMPEDTPIKGEAPMGPALGRFTGGALRTAAPLAERAAGGIGRLLTHLADEYIPSWLKPVRGPVRDVGRALENIPKNMEALRAGQTATDEIAAMNERLANRPLAPPPAKPPYARYSGPVPEGPIPEVPRAVPSHATGGSGAHAQTQVTHGQPLVSEGPPRIIQPSADFTARIKDQSQLVTMLKAMGASEAEIARVVRQGGIDLASSTWK